MFKKLVVCLSLLNMGAYAIEWEFVSIPSPRNCLFTESKVGLEVMKDGFFSVPEDQRFEIDLNKSVETQPLDKDGLEALVSVFGCYAADKETLAEMINMFYDIPPEQHRALINSRDDAGDTPLIIASRNENLEGVKWLVKEGADIYAKNAAGLDALHCTVSNDRQDVANYLRIQYNLKGLVHAFCGSAAYKNKFGYTKEIFNSIPKELKELRSQLINYPDSGGRNALMTAAINGNFEAVKFLVENGADIYAVDDSGRDAYSLAEQNRHTYVMEYLGNHFFRLVADKDKVNDIKRIFFRIPEKQRIQLINRPDHSLGGISALMTASFYGNLEAIKFLVEHGADVYARCDLGYTACDLARMKNHPEIVDYLLRRQMDKPRRAEIAHSSAQDAVKAFISMGDRSSVKPLKIDAYDIELQAAKFRLLASAQDNLKGMIKLFYNIPEEQRRQVINRPDYYGFTALMKASFYGNFDGVRFLVEHGADVYAKCVLGYTACDLAMQRKHPEIVDYLLSRMCKPRRAEVAHSSAMFDGSSAKNPETDEYALAKLRGDKEVAGYLRDSVNLIKGHAQNLSSLISDKNRLVDMIKMFDNIPEELRSEVIHCSDSLGRSAWMTASLSGNLEAVRFLVEHGANIYAKDDDGHDAYALAKQNGHTEIVKYLDSQIEKGQNAETIEVARATLQGLAYRLGFYTKDTTEFNRMRGWFFSIPEEQRSKVINCRDLLLGRNVLMKASSNGNLRAVKFLVEHGADIYAVDKCGRDAYKLAKQNGHVEIADYLRSREEVR